MTTSGIATQSNSGSGLTSEQMKKAGSFAGWNIDNQGGIDKIWRIYEGQTAPLLRNFLTAIDLNNINKTYVYDGKNHSLDLTAYDPSKLILSSGTTQGTNAGKYTANYYSNQQGYDLIGIGPTLTITPKALIIIGSKVADKDYDGTTTAQVTAGTLSGLVGNEKLGITGTGQFNSKDVLTADIVTAHYTLQNGSNGGLASNYSLADENLKASIKAKALNIVNMTVSDKEYDRSTLANLSSGQLSGLVGNETLGFIAGSGSYADANAGAGKAVTVTGSTLSDATGLASNYSLSNPTGLTGNILKAKAIVTANSLNTVYNGQNQTASGFTASGLVNGEDESVLTAVTASVSAKDAGHYDNIATGTDKNYDLTFVNGSLDIAKAKISQVTGLTANNRVYDATTNASLNTSSAQFDGIVSGDELLVATATGQFSDKNAATGKQVSINSISLNGADAHNYELVSNTAQTTADIIQANIGSITEITADSRTYDGLTAAMLNTDYAKFNGIYAGDQLTVATATGQFDNATPGQAKTVSITGLSLGGVDAQNYNLKDTTAMTSAAIQLLTPANYLQAIQLKRPRYLPETNNALNTVNLDIRQGGVNTSGIQTLKGEY
ncbi:YDG domain-containing protein [Acinetobacter sp. TSRC1-2]|uniref:YDG domain-containing protein n=1 Tax=unclassified Acinetobacter TaxID=196816 RepID=UPI003CF1D8F8